LRKVLWKRLNKIPIPLRESILAAERKLKFLKKEENPWEMAGIIGARENNLKNINVRIPLGVFTCITGVSGSGKSSLINEICTSDWPPSLTEQV